MKKFAFLCLFLLIGLQFGAKNVNAYVLNNQNVGYTCQYNNLSSANGYTTNLNKATAWNYDGTRVYVKSSSSGKINIYQGVVNTDNGTYGVCYYNTNSESDIRYYKAFINANTATRNETVVHEVGHAIGLSHTQEKNNSIAVMRALGFNNKAYPLSDDKSGMNKKY
ncbi:matrixin family metalloprotease [Enterococcus sp. N342-3-1-2]